MHPPPVMNTLKLLAGTVLALALLVAPPAAAAAEAGGSPAGTWRTIDDATHRPKSIVRLWEQDGAIYGVIEKIFPEPGKPADPICDRCDGALKNKRVQGMTFLWGLRRDGDEWSGGRVVDPENGKIYRCFVKVVDHGRRLKVRGYVGLSMFGRTQYWEQVPVAPPPQN